MRSTNSTRFSSTSLTALLDRKKGSRASVGGQFTSLTCSRVTDYLPAHGLLSALLTVKLPEHWTAEVYGNNLTDTIYHTGEGLNSGNYYFYGAPRQYGLRATYDF